MRCKIIKQLTIFTIVSFLCCFMAHNHDAYAQPCKAEASPSITVVPSSAPVQYDFSKSTQDLTAQNKNHRSPSTSQPGSQVLGQHLGRITSQIRLVTQIRTNTQTQLSCISIKSIEIMVHLDPKIFISRDHFPGSCKHNVIHQHELMHLQTDQQIILDYTSVIQQNLYRYFAKVPNVIGPVVKAAIPSARSELSSRVDRITAPIFKTMEKDRDARHGRIDTPEEYARIARLCQ